MANKEMYDYLSVKVADYTTTTLDIAPDNVFTETGDINQVVHEYDDGDVDVVTLSSNNIFECTLEWNDIPESDSGLIMDMYHDSNKANGRARTFYWKHVDGHTYTVRFMDKLSRTYDYKSFAGGNRSIKEITLKIEGRKEDV